MLKIFAAEAYLPGGWEESVLINVDQSGSIIDVATNQNKPGEAVSLSDPLIPGVANLHSHAHQRAMAGRSEYRASGAGEQDSFWTWRTVMHRFAELLTPNMLEVVATQLYIEMLEAGYTSVCEFHYVHHGPGGTLYAEPAEMSFAIIRAAQAAGIGLTLLPVLYSQGGYNGKQPNEGQRRFISTPETLLTILESLHSVAEDDPNMALGLSLHSPRQITVEAAKEVLDALWPADDTSPIHIHVAEQEKDVTESLEVTGLRPVDWTFENFDVNERWCLVHATHLDHAECRRLARSGAVAGICPTTEANLGDGLFPLIDYMSQNGYLGIGSDSHVSVNWIEELRLLEYAQRLVQRRRNLSADGPGGSTGQRLFAEMMQGGAKAAGRPVAGIGVGQRADFMTLDRSNPILAGIPTSQLFDAAVFSGNRPLIKDVWVGGAQVVVDGHHQRHDTSATRYNALLQSLEI